MFLDALIIVMFTPSNILEYVVVDDVPFVISEFSMFIL